MTSDRAGDPISKEPVGSNSVSAASSVGGHDPLTEAPTIEELLADKSSWIHDWLDESEWDFDLRDGA